MRDTFYSPKAKGTQIYIQLSLGEIRKGFFHLCVSLRNIFLSSEKLLSDWCVHHLDDPLIATSQSICAGCIHRLQRSHPGKVGLHILHRHFGCIHLPVHPTQDPTFLTLLFLYWLRTLLPVLVIAS